MSLLKNCRSFLSNFFFIPAGMLQRNSNMTRLWMFPLSSLSEAEKVLGEISNYKVQLEVVKAKIKSAKSKDESESVKFTQKNLINKIYTNSADAKIPATLEYLGTFIEAGCKFLIFAHHQPMIDAIHECLLKKKVGCIWIDGGTPAASRQQLVTDFQEKDYIKAAVLSIKAGGVGLTLTAASTVIFTEQSWTPGDLIQAKDRAYRIGQVFSHSLSRKERVVTSCMTTLRKQIISNEKNSHI
ncbi:uncharacterized protein LOC107484479 isoform X4 [Arachis duranensis]|uniref:Uncharacterized protein LOC107484479 isoform X4 n=1 Tax=Arachis duranensis TaxID=130453 RepID=A0A9C6THZ9_ARADU|nr:uncharacterized protein LOC107484479 isoform X4 [Arachis duranensis]XP_052114459.1 uncharacterized protein LOC107484479 isoform X4 [Arachis duranensis]XP_052114460.1 uncharacterized protein LOC107484479 isoform X4 [Arachis duranensis]